MSAVILAVTLLFHELDGSDYEAYICANVNPEETKLLAEAANRNHLTGTS